MRRLLSQILIIILLLLGPITFTTANIPNFQPDCETGSSLRTRTSVKVAISDRPQQIIPQELPESPPQQIIEFIIHPSNGELFFPACYSRPPPLC